MNALARDLAQALAVTPHDEFQRTYRDDPAGFLRDCVIWRDGESATPYQKEIVRDLLVFKRESVRGPHGLGKTTIAALTLLWFALTRDGLDWKVITTASAWRQLTHYLWPEVHKWTRRLRWDRIGRAPFDERLELQKMSLRLGTGEAFAVASNDPATIEGAHADHLLYIFDEAKTIIPGTWDAAEGAFSGAGSDTVSEALALSISTPGEPTGRFYEIQSRKPGTEDWHVRAVTKAEAIAAKRISADWIEARKRQWGESSAVYQNRVEGNFAAADELNVIPLRWVEMAIERWHAWNDDPEAAVPPLTSVGVDVADTGEAKTVMALRHDHVIAPLRVFTQQETMSTAGKIVGLLHGHPAAYAVVDVIGMGAGVVSRLREQVTATQLEAFNAGASPGDLTDRSGELRFVNRRAAGWWALRDELDPEWEPTLCLPPDDELIGDLTAPHYDTTSNGRVLIEKKADMMKRLGRSTDRGDAVMHACVPRPVRRWGAFE